MNTRGAGRRNTLIAAAVIVVCGIIAYHAVLPHPYVYDDLPGVQDNPNLRSLFDPPSALEAPRFSAPDGRPLVALSFALNHAVAGIEPAGFRVVNIAIHLLAALVLFGVVRRTLRGPRLVATFGGAADALGCVVALLWVLHPLQPESVTYVSQRTASLAGLFYLLTLYCAIRSLSSEKRALWALVSVLSCALGLLSKEIVATAPLVVALYLWAYADGPRIASLRRHAGLLAGLAVTWAIPVYLLGPWSPYAQRVTFGMAASATTNEVVASQGSAVWNYALNQCWVLLDYAWHVVCPHPLVVDYGMPKSLTLGDVWLEGVIVSIGVIGAIVLFWRRPSLGFPILAALFILAPTSSIVPIHSEVGAERRMYVPLAGALALLVICAYALLRRIGPEARTLGFGAAGIAAIALLVLTLGRNEDFSSEIAYWKSGSEAAPWNYRAHHNLGAGYLLANDVAAAEPALRRSLELNPGYRDSAANLAMLLKAKGRIPEAIEQYEVAGRSRQFAFIHVDLSGLYTLVGRFDDARRELDIALRIEPNNHTAFHNYGVVEATEGNAKEAIAWFRKALAADPNYAQAHINFGRILSTLGYLDASRHHFEQGLQRAQNNISALQGLAWILATHPEDGKRNARAAVELAARAVELSGHRDSTVLDALATAHANAGDFPRAIAAGEAALRIAGSNASPYSRELRDRLTGFRSNVPWRSNFKRGTPP